MSLSPLLQPCSACLVRLSWIFFVMGDKCRTAAVVWGAASGTCSIFLAAFKLRKLLQKLERNSYVSYPTED